MTEESFRPDGRGPKELRPLKVEVGVLDRAEGSARVALGKNIAIASVYGPREMHPKHASLPDKAVVRINYRMATFSVDDYKRSYPSRREKEISMVLSKAYESIIMTSNWPRSVVDVHVQLLQSDGGTRTVASIAIAAALADAGIPMRDIAAGIASGLYEDQVVLDLSGHEDMKGTGDMPLLYSPANDEIILFQLDGKFTYDQFKDAFNTSKDAITDIVLKIREALKEKYLKIRDEIGVDDDDTEETVDTTLLDDDAVVEPVEVDSQDEEEVEEEEPIAATQTQPEEKSEKVIVTTPTTTPAEGGEVTSTTTESSEPSTSEAVSEPQVEPKSSIAKTIASLDKEELSLTPTNNWYTKSGAELNPMPANTAYDRSDDEFEDDEDEDDDDDDTVSVMRDIEYLDDDTDTIQEEEEEE